MTPYFRQCNYRFINTLWIRQKKLAQYLKAKESYEEKMSIEIPYARNCCQHKRGNMYWWEDDHDCIEYPNICMWMKGKMKLREIYDPENDTWHILNPDQRLAHYLGAEYELMTWNPLVSSPLDHVMSYLYLKSFILLIGKSVGNDGQISLGAIPPMWRY